MCQSPSEGFRGAGWPQEWPLTWHLGQTAVLGLCRAVRGARAQPSLLPAGARMVRELFVMAREHAPSIIFMDEIDSIGSSRLEGGSGGDSEVQRTMLELLNQLDGFEATKNIKVGGCSPCLGTGQCPASPVVAVGCPEW